MKVLGFRKSSFKGTDGSDVTGFNIYVEDGAVPEKYGQGVATDRFFITAQKLRECNYSLAVGDEINVLYNKYGKISSLQKA